MIILYNKVNSISVEYGDTKITFFQINLQAETVNQSLWHDHRYYEIHFCQKDSLEYTFSDQTVRLNPGELLIIPPDTFHKSITAADKLTPEEIKQAVRTLRRNNCQPFEDGFYHAISENAL